MFGTNILTWNSEALFLFLHVNGGTDGELFSGEQYLASTFVPSDDSLISPLSLALLNKSVLSRSQANPSSTHIWSLRVHSQSKLKENVNGEIEGSLPIGTRPTRLQRDEDEQKSRGARRIQVELLSVFRSQIHLLSSSFLILWYRLVSKLACYWWRSVAAIECWSSPMQF